MICVGNSAILGRMDWGSALISYADSKGYSLYAPDSLMNDTSFFASRGTSDLVYLRERLKELGYTISVKNRVVKVRKINDDRIPILTNDLKILRVERDELRLRKLADSLLKEREYLKHHSDSLASIVHLKTPSKILVTYFEISADWANSIGFSWLEQIASGSLNSLSGPKWSLFLTASKSNLLDYSSYVLSLDSTASIYFGKSIERQELIETDRQIKTQLKTEQFGTDINLSLHDNGVRIRFNVDAPPPARVVRGDVIGVMPYCIRSNSINEKEYLKTVPILSSVPFLGRLFEYSEKRESSSIIFLCLDNEYQQKNIASDSLQTLRSDYQEQRPRRYSELYDSIAHRIGSSRLPRDSTIEIQKENIEEIKE